MKTRKRFIRFVIVSAVVIVLLTRFLWKWHYGVSVVPFVDVDISLSSELELVSPVELLLKISNSDRDKHVCNSKQ